MTHLTIRLDNGDDVGIGDDAPLHVFYRCACSATGAQGHTSADNVSLFDLMYDIAKNRVHAILLPNVLHDEEDMRTNLLILVDHISSLSADMEEVVTN